MGRLGYVPSLSCAEFAMCRAVPKSNKLQAGFRTTDRIYTIKTIIKKYL